MAKRSWLVRPDYMLPDTEGNPIAVVSQQALIGAASEGAVMVGRAGGVFTMTAQRVETGVPNERVTVAALCEWKDRTDAKPQPEREGPPLVSHETHVLLDQHVLLDEPEVAPAPGEVDGHPVGVAPDGEPVDESDVPEHLRG